MSNQQSSIKTKNNCNIAFEFHMATQSSDNKKLFEVSALL